MDKMEEYDYIVVGAGIEGSSTALHLAKSMKKTLQLEQFFLPHTRGSSHGQSRITRYSYPEPYFAHMMFYAYNYWDELSKITNTQLYNKVGVLTLSEPPSTVVRDSIDTMRTLDISHEVLTPKLLKKRFPMLKFPETYQAVFEETGGVLRADKCLRAMQDVFVKYGGVLHDNEKVLDIIPYPSSVVVKTSKSTYRAHKVVICAGAWSGQLLKDLGLNLPLKIHRISVCYWKYLVPNKSYHLPSAIISCSPSTDIYAIPSSEYPDLVKVCYHSGVIIPNPDMRDVNASYDSYDIDILKAFIRESMPGVEDKPAIIESCMYTNTPDCRPVLDRHPNFPNIIIGAGFSGHGFKLAPSVGKLLSELAMEKPASFETKPFSATRFDNKISSKY